jgi:uncharacterized protein
LATEFHNKGFVDRCDATVGCCWDADRLNLWRLDIEPDTQYLSTSAACGTEVIDWAMMLHETAPGWDIILSSSFNPRTAAGWGEPSHMEDDWVAERACP